MLGLCEQVTLLMESFPRLVALMLGLKEIAHLVGLVMTPLRVFTQAKRDNEGGGGLHLGLRAKLTSNFPDSQHVKRHVKRVRAQVLGEAPIEVLPNTRSTVSLSCRLVPHNNTSRFG